ncbi:FecR family protein [Parapedobacter luteus]|uniref:FecR family protein n=1 Tax=Parapedobacter luteus TaxID=623280 RepID=A0A1T5C4F4_9SPHI|nr:FecR family protein [Parapedobacter luteus]SKB54462.1 FecR family protein [Parapedobacter luteus]
MDEKEALDFSQSLLRYLRMELTPDEERVFLQSVASDPAKQKLLDYYRNTSALQKDFAYAERLNVTAAWEKVHARTAPHSSAHNRTQRRMANWKWLYRAAALVAAVAMAMWWYSSRQDGRVIADSQFGFKNDVLPGDDRATLVLSNGKTVSLDQSERSIKEGKHAISQTKNGMLSYLQQNGVDPSHFNEIRVPYAGQYKVTLADGTVVWVNSGSTLKFPVQFSGNERRVFLDGEAFFDVAKDPNRPFFVEAEGKTIEVVGTRFNVSAYSEEVQATLVEGAVKIMDTRSVRLLTPGQQAVCKPTGIDVLPANLERVTAWKDGYFVFDGNHIQTIMEQIARWYQVQVHYEGKIQQDVYSGSVPRNSTLGGVLRMLADVSDLRFEIDGRNVIVSNNH